MTVDMYHYTAPKRQDRPGYCQVPLRFRNATSTTTTLEDIGSIKFDDNMGTTTAAVIFDKTSCASTSTTERPENVYFPYTASNSNRSDNARFEGITPRRRP